MSPYVFVLDIDGTLVGNVSYLVAQWEILTQFNKKSLRLFKSMVIEQLRDGLLRSQLTEFIKSLSGTCEFFIYTASDDKWAQFFVPCIEAASGIKFSRPIFSRKHCLQIGTDLKKSLQKISSLIYPKLKPLFKSKSAMYQRMLLVDNNKVLLDRETRKSVLCPTYEYMTPFDIVSLVDQRIFLENAYLILKIMSKYGLVQDRLISRKLSGFQLLGVYYSCLAHNLVEYGNNIQKYNEMRRDKFWPKMLGLFVACHQKGASIESIVKYINENVNKE
jgi:hypothetical protein